MRQRQRVVITGLGAVTPLGNTIEDFWRRLCAGESGIGPITHFDASAYESRIAGEIKELHIPASIPPAQLKHFARYTLLALIAALEAWEDADLPLEVEDAYDIGVIIGNSHGGEEGPLEAFRALAKQEPEKVSPRLISRMLTNMASSHVARHLQLHGPVYAPAAACASGALAIGEASEIIRRGAATIMLCGGAEACITPLTLAGDQAIKALSRRNQTPTQACRPFDSTRDGFVLAEGAGILVLEEYEHALARGAHIYAELSGYGTTTDALHETRPHPEGIHFARAMQLALREAEVTPSAIDAIFAHATGTSLGDRAETAAMRLAMGDALPQIPIVALKAALGHLMGASGAVQAIAAIKALHTQILPPTLNVHNRDPYCSALQILPVARALPMQHILANATGFGGHNISLLFQSLP